MHKRLIALLLVSPVAGWTQNQVATVTASAPFTLRGAVVTPSPGVPTWPVLPGDALAAGKSPTAVTFADGSVLVLAHESTAKIDLLNGKPVFQLISGNAQYSLKSTSAVQLMAGGKTEVPKGLTGTIKVVSHKTVVIAVVGGAVDVAAKTYGIDKAIAGDPAASGP
jgi:hypothetical protein